MLIVIVCFDFKIFFPVVDFEIISPVKFDAKRVVVLFWLYYRPFHKTLPFFTGFYPREIVQKKVLGYHGLIL